jgi:hypothetical protein
MMIARLKSFHAAMGTVMIGRMLRIVLKTARGEFVQKNGVLFAAGTV